MLFIAMYLMDIALEVVHLPRRATLKLMLSVGVMRPGLLLFATMFLCWFLSMFINTVAVTLMITPFAVGLMSATEENQLNLETSDGSQSSEDGKEVSSQIQRFSRGLLLGIAYSSTAGGMATLTGSIPNRFLGGIDLLKEEIDWINWFRFALPISFCTFLAAYGLLCMRYVWGSHGLRIAKETLEAMHEELLTEIGPLTRDEFLVGFLQLAQIVLLIIYPFIERMIRTQYGAGLLSDFVPAAIPSVLLFFIPSVVRPGQAVLTWPDVHDKFDFGILLLIGGGFAISQGFVESGLTEGLGTWFAGLTSSVPSFWLTLLITLIGAVCTQLFSAIAFATASLPIFQSAAMTSVVNPLRLQLPATISCSLAFMLPTATPANVVVLAKSQDLSKPLRVREFFFSGLPLNLISVVICGTLVHLMGEAVFESGSPLPASMCSRTLDSCYFLNIPGEVEGEKVLSQACIFKDQSNSSEPLCMLWNGTLVEPCKYTDCDGRTGSGHGAPPASDGSAPPDPSAAAGPPQPSAAGPPAPVAGGVPVPEVAPVTAPPPPQPVRRLTRG